MILAFLKRRIYLKRLYVLNHYHKYKNIICFNNASGSLENSDKLFRFIFHMQFESIQCKANTTKRQKCQVSRCNRLKIAIIHNKIIDKTANVVVSPRKYTVPDSWLFLFLCYFVLLCDISELLQQLNWFRWLSSSPLEYWIQCHWLTSGPYWLLN